MEKKHLGVCVLDSGKRKAVMGYARKGETFILACPLMVVILVA